MTTKRSSKKIKKSDAMQFLDKLIDEPLTFGSLIKTIRDCDEITQSQLANKLGTTKAHICDIEKGRKMVTPARAARYAKILGYSEAQFVRLAITDQIEQAGLKLKVTVEAA
jgi:transcriptional regulator with XRE-family HTH domain